MHGSKVSIIMKWYVKLHLEFYWIHFDAILIFFLFQDKPTNIAGCLNN